MRLRMLHACSLLMLSTASCGPDDAAPAPAIDQARARLGEGSGRENGTYLSHAYVTTQSYVDLVPSLLGKMRTNEVKNLYVNLGKLGVGGTVVDTYAKVEPLLAAISTWEQSNGYTFRVFGWVSGSFEGTDALDLDATTGAATRSAMQLECKRFLSSSISGSHVPSSARPFDGCLFDLEPSGPYASATDDKHFNDWKSLMQALRTDLNGSGLGAKQLGAAAHRYGDASKWKWPMRYFYYMARYVNQVTVMTYNSASTTAADYQLWTQAQTRDVLRAVSGVAYGDGSHPAPTNGVKVLVGFPAYPESVPNHLVAAETVPAAAQGTTDALAALEADANDGSEAFFGGATMYLTTDGADTSTYARFSVEWAQWQSSWLGL